MKNLDKALKTLEKAHLEIHDEMDYYMDVNSDDPEYTKVDAFDDTYSLAELYKQRSIMSKCYPLFIDMGYAVPVDISKVKSTGKKYWFKLNDIYYEPVMGWPEWINQ